MGIQCSKTNLGGTIGLAGLGIAGGEARADNLEVSRLLKRFSKRLPSCGVWLSVVGCALQRHRQTNGNATQAPPLNPTVKQIETLHKCPGCSGVHTGDWGLPCVAASLMPIYDVYMPYLSVKVDGSIFQLSGTSSLRIACGGSGM